LYSFSCNNHQTIIHYFSNEKCVNKYFLFSFTKKIIKLQDTTFHKENISSKFLFICDQKFIPHYNRMIFENKNMSWKFLFFFAPEKSSNKNTLTTFALKNIYLKTFCFFLHTKIMKLWYTTFSKKYLLNPSFFSCRKNYHRLFLKIDEFFDYSKPKTSANYNTVYSKENVWIKNWKWFSLVYI